ncbi:MAG: tRNA-dihydrouridine synthase [Peptostreptococcaceae bacterium]|nr:tRNA-dihydrouridine synthase [Peptostreptococcaceae bacterium]
MNITFMSLKLKNPIIVSAGPWSRDGESIRKAIEAGAGAVITESIVSDTIIDVRPRIAYNGKGAQNIRLYSDVQIEGWEREMKIAKSGGGIVIASISGHTPSELAYLAAKLEFFGADAIEISVSNPMGEALEILASDADQMYMIVKEVVNHVDIPVLVKLSQTATNISRVAKAAKKAGASGVSAINAVRCILGVDIETGELMLPTYGGYSGAPIRPLGLAAVATIAQTVDIPICGIGGIDNYKNAIEYIMLGASAVQIGTTVMINGFERITEIVRDFEAWERDKKIKSINEIKGKALLNLKSFDEMKVEPAICYPNGEICVEACNACIKGCMYGAIARTEIDVTIDKNLCTGCGVCQFVCPIKKLSLKW